MTQALIAKWGNIVMPFLPLFYGIYCSYSNDLSDK